jgi:nucleotide-binding universal stress UspA family protein
MMSRRWPPSSRALVFTALDSKLEGSPEHESELGWIAMLQRTARDELESAGLTVELAVATGDPRRLLPQKAKEWDADCIFVGSTGHSRLKRLFLGSVASAVARRAPCSVEVVRAQTAVR